MLGLTAPAVRGQSLPSNADPLPAIRQHAAAEQWDEVVHLAESVPARSAGLNYYYGMALARLGRWDEARTAFLAGHQLQPQDPRFPVELGGVNFLQKRYPEAAVWLRRALRLDSDDTYANDLLATVYFMQGNLEAALKYWNRVGKPHVAAVRVVPQLRVRPSLLDRAFAFSPASSLRLPDLLTSDVRVRALGIFPTHTFDLAACPDNRFDVIFRAQERNGWGSGKWQALVSTFRGIFYQTVTPEYSNLGRSAVNLSALIRWDTEKRRLQAAMSRPLRADAKWRYRIVLDLRNENWDIRNPSSNPAPLLAGLNLRREAAGVEITSFSSGRWQWSAGAELSHRDYRGLTGAAPSELLLSGYALKHLARVNYEWLRVPEHRLVARAALRSQIGTLWSQPRHGFAKVQATVETHWLPRARGDDYENRLQLRAGMIFGRVPFDELFMLGVDRDNDLWLRAHAATHNGRNGNAPLGRRYFLANWEMDKNVYRNGLFTFKLGPFFDTGKITDSSPLLGPKAWLVDTGVQAKAGVLGVQVLFSYGKDLRTGRNVFYVTTAR